MPLDRPLLTLSENPNRHHQKTARTVSRFVWRYCCQAGVWNWQMINWVIESQFSTLLCKIDSTNGSALWRQALSDMYTCHILIPGVTPTQSPENDHLHIYSLCSWHFLLNSGLLTLGNFWWSVIWVFKNPSILAMRYIWRNQSSAGVSNFQIQKQVVKSQLIFAFMWNAYHRRLSDINSLR